MRAASIDRARAAKVKALATFSRLGEVVGVGITQINGGYAVKVNLRDRPAPGVKLPDTVDGVPVRVEVVGIIRKL
jgi:hypothetical protein